MMRRMAVDVVVFVALTAIFLFSYGIASQSLLFPLRNFDQRTVINVFYR